MDDLSSNNFTEFYKGYLKQNNLKQDAWQLQISEYFNNLAKQIIKSQSSSFLGSLFSNNDIRGIYLWGNVGRGKTLLCKNFLEYIKQYPQIKSLFIHYHDFIKLVHEQIHQAKIKSSSTEPIIETANYFIGKYHLIVLDEFQILDISDAMILSRIFEKLYQNNIILILTSNREPRNLYHESYGREHVDKFVNIIYQYQQVLSLDGNDDYRTQKILDNQQLFFYPNNAENNLKIDYIITQLTENRVLNSTQLMVFGRSIQFDKTYNKLLISDFNEICLSNFSQNDYITICQNFEIIIVKNIPKLTKDMNNEAKRFIMLIDQAYNHKVILICSFECEINQLYTEGKGSFEFHRTISRLYEMQSTDYTHAKFQLKDL